MDTAPRLLLTDEQQAVWLSGRRDSELNQEFVNSDAWKRVFSHPRLRIYQTGKLDSVLIGGDRHYGKLHAKCFFVGDFGFVGTSNFDYRSRVFNNEMGFYYLDPELSGDLNRVFEQLKAISLRWGSEDWLEMRRRLIAQGGFKGYTTATQRGRYKFLKGTGLIWLF
jgi:phosphatidylserine/phosphatidylglycerophosphate/cardiolipin synthase-like enzyme